MKKIILAATVCLLALGMNACKDQKKDEASAGQEQAVPAGEEHKAEGHENGAAADMGKKVDEAITDVKKDVENAAASAHDSAKEAKDAAKEAKDAVATPAPVEPAAPAAH